MMITGGQERSLPSDKEANAGGERGALHKEVSFFAPPPSLARINCLLSSAPVDLNSLGEAVKEESALVSETLKLCNSSLFGLSHPVVSLEQAVIIMGSDMVRALLCACWLVQFTGARVPAQENFSFWRHSLLVARLSRRLSGWTGCAQQEWAFLAGLFHDIGILPFLTMLSRSEAAESGSVFETIGDRVEMQRRRFTTDHCELGLLLGAELGLPAPLVEACARHHHRGGTLSHTSLSRLSGAAEMIAQAATGNGSAPSTTLSQVIQRALAEYLAGYDRLASASVIEALESDLRGAVMERRGGGSSIWEDHISSLKTNAGVAGSSQAGG
jgi:HD-like signal output (HDOD) protein